MQAGFTPSGETGHRQAAQVEATRLDAPEEVLDLRCRVAQDLPSVGQRALDAIERDAASDEDAGQESADEQVVVDEIDVDDARDLRATEPDHVTTMRHGDALWRIGGACLDRGVGLAHVGPLSYSGARFYRADNHVYIIS